jgi:hypothetical protein
MFLTENADASRRFIANVFMWMFVALGYISPVRVHSLLTRHYSHIARSGYRPKRV